MEKRLEKFLEFNGKSISLLSVDGTWWVALKPICEALNVNYERQRQNIQEDEILSQLPANQQVVAADNKLREMLCLPEKFIYGWLFSIRSDSPELKEYKLKCYEVLYNYFHGTITQRVKLLQDKNEALTDTLAIKEELEEDERHVRLKDLSKKVKLINKSLKQLDIDLEAGQIPIFN
jgi:hypothetical protein